jgi:hypothetical protein
MAAIKHIYAVGYSAGATTRRYWRSTAGCGRGHSPSASCAADRHAAVQLPAVERSNDAPGVLYPDTPRSQPNQPRNDQCAASALIARNDSTVDPGATPTLADRLRKRAGAELSFAGVNSRVTLLATLSSSRRRAPSLDAIRTSCTTTADAKLPPAR